MITISIDEENSADIWWVAARADAAAPSAFHTLDDLRRDAVTLPEPAAAALLRWARRLPGWNGGPAYAPNPLVWNEE